MVYSRCLIYLKRPVAFRSINVFNLFSHLIFFCTKKTMDLNALSVDLLEFLSIGFNWARKPTLRKGILAWAQKVSKENKGVSTAKGVTS